MWFQQFPLKSRWIFIILRIPLLDKITALFRDDFPSPSSSDKRYAVILVGSHTKVWLLLALEPNLIIRLLVWRIPCVYSRDGDKILEFLAFGNVKKQKQRMVFCYCCQSYQNSKETHRWKVSLPSSDLPARCCKGWTQPQFSDLLHSFFIHCFIPTVWRVTCKRTSEMFI